MPQLGTFIVKVPDGGVVFSELLRRDDGVLRALLVSEQGVTDLEAAGRIDRFVFEVRHTLEREGVYPINGFGRMTLSPVGAIVFHHEPVATSAVGSASNQGPMSSAQTTADSDPKAALLFRQTRPEKSASNEIAEPKISISPKREPESYVKGLRYGKPHKTTEGYTLVGSKSRRRVDKFLVIAVMVALLAVAAIVYGYLRRSAIEQQEREYMEQPVTPDATTTPSGGDVK